MRTLNLNLLHALAAVSLGSSSLTSMSMSLLQCKTNANDAYHFALLWELNEKMGG